jgi:hypothetical protein
MLACDERGFIWLPRRRPAGCLVPCIICGQPLENESAGNNEPVGGLAFECGGHWPRAVFDAEPGWLEINICEPCLHRAANGRRILPGDHASRRSPAVYKSCNGRNRSDRDLPRDLPSRDDGLEQEGPYLILLTVHKCNTVGSMATVSVARRKAYVTWSDP